MDPKTKATFYYNKKMDVSQWTKPLPVASPALAAPTATPTAMTTTPTVTSTINPTVAAAAAQPAAQPVASGAQALPSISRTPVTATPTGRSTTPSPSATPARLLSPSTDADDLNLSDLQNADDTVLDAQQLPPGWKALVEPQSGKTYYYDPLSGTTSWEAPYFLSVEKAAKMRVRAASMTQVALTQAARFSPEEYATLLELPDTYRELARKGGSWLGGSDFVKLREATAAMNAFQEGVRNRGVRLTATEAAKLRMTADGVQRILDTPTMMGGLAMSDADKDKLADALVILREFSVRADGASGLKPVTLTAADSARLREATAMVKEVGDKINGNRSAKPKPRPKSLPSQGIAPINAGAAPAHPTGL